MVYSLQADIGLSHLAHLDGGLHADGHALLLKNVSHGKAVEHGGHHAHMVGAGALHTASAVLHAAPKVAAADDYAYLDAGFVALFDNVANLADYLKIKTS